ncbi:hypothetical protein VR45_27325 [Streptomyces sp. NRRL S-495]|nr:hypothetical protein VR45_27325 [Streptomyces sp. NRRL S-495]
MTTTVLKRRGVRALLAFAVAAAVAVPGLGAASPARADTPDGTTKVVEVKLDHNYTGGNVAGYHTALIRLRQAAGRQFRDDDVYLTQATPPGLIALRIQDKDGNELSSLYFNPASLYVGGFRTRSGKLYAFNDASENVRTEMGRGGQVNTLAFGGSYGSLVATAGDEPSIEWLNGFIGSAEIHRLGRDRRQGRPAAGRGRRPGRRRPGADQADRRLLRGGPVHRLPRHLGPGRRRAQRRRLLRDIDPPAAGAARRLGLHLQVRDRHHHRPVHASPDRQRRGHVRLLAGRPGPPAGDPPIAGLRASPAAGGAGSAQRADPAPPVAPRVGRRGSGGARDRCAGPVHRAASSDSRAPVSPARAAATKAASSNRCSVGSTASRCGGGPGW